ncbi:hypothetical protein Lalb_Chr15g0079211 [Lupinus albus]|uniref:Uncharacterized protein n=1 Tax=Lupinus albus TaxID=3870 RepID=A0A6A4PDB7_LUPAL|nr:hypothetical protein Lalb_Chr15g0079211 [Lupinus albus]
MIDYARIHKEFVDMKDADTMAIGEGDTSEGIKERSQSSEVIRCNDGSTTISVMIFINFFTSEF